jgi:hypothetical protein
MKNYRLEQSFNEYNRNMDAIYMELYSLKESYSSEDWNLLREGFWDKVKAIGGGAANAAGKAVGNVTGAIKKSVDYVHDLGTSVYDKGVELGKKAVEVTKDFYNKAAAAITQGIDSIRKAPGQLWDSVTNLCSTLAGEISETYKKAKAKGEEWLKAAKETAINLYRSMAEGLSSLYKSTKEWANKNIEAFKKMVVDKKSELLEIAGTARKSANVSIKQIGESIVAYFEKFKDGAIKVSKSLGMLVIGLVSLPLYGVYIMTKKTYELGEDLAAAASAGFDKLKAGLGDAWSELKSVGAEMSKQFKGGKEEAENWWEKLSDEEKVKMASNSGNLAVAESFRYVKTFESFKRNI